MEGEIWAVGVYSPCRMIRASHVKRGTTRLDDSSARHFPSTMSVATQKYVHMPTKGVGQYRIYPISNKQTHSSLIYGSIYRTHIHIVPEAIFIPSRKHVAQTPANSSNPTSNKNRIPSSGRRKQKSMRPHYI